MNEKEIAEVNKVIAEIEAALEPNCEIGARDKSTVKNLMKNSNLDKKTKFFNCRREISAKILHHFVKGKGLPQSKFSTNAQPNIFIIY